MCGFTPCCCQFTHATTKQRTTQLKQIPSKSAFSHFLNQLRKCKKELTALFEELVRYMYENLDHFGEILALNGKAIQSFAQKVSANPNAGYRGEREANWCKKTYTTTTAKGEVVTKTTKRFGFRLHLLVDATYEMPVAFSLTPAADSEKTVAKEMLSDLQADHPDRVATADYLLGDRGYDSLPLIRQIKSMGISPIIDICNHWREDKKGTRQVKDRDLVYTYNGKVSYVNEKGQSIPLRSRGYDRKKKSLRYGFHPKYKDSRLFRIPLSTDERIFTPVDRQSKKWKRLYKKRTSIERVNARMDRDFGFEKHTIRGLEKMYLFILVSFITGLSLSKAKIHNKETEHLVALVS